MTAGTPRVDILILNFNGWRDTLECLESVFRLDYPAFRVIVCDNGSRDDSWDRLIGWAEGRHVASEAANPLLSQYSAPPVPKPISYVALEREAAERGGRNDAEDSARLVLIQANANLGFTGGNNVGLRFFLRGTSDYVLLLNNDTVIAPNAVTEMVGQATRDSQLAAVGATLLDYRQTDLVQETAGGTVALWHGMVRTSQAGARRGATRPSPRLDYVSGGCMLVRRLVVEQVGLLDERFFIYAEDVDWCVRMRGRQFQLGYSPQAEIWHKGGGTTVPKSPFNDYHNLRSSLLFVHKHRPRFLPLAFAWSVYRCVLPKLVRAQWSRLGPTARAYRDVVREIW